MSAHKYLYTSGILLVALLMINAIQCQLTEDNEVGPEYMLQGVKVYQADRQCALVGGLCVHHSDCLSPTTNRGLCPSSAHRGVECCYELPMRPAPCVQHMGECMERCHKTLMRPGTDCENGQVCCVLV